MGDADMWHYVTMSRMICKNDSEYCRFVKIVSGVVCKTTCQEDPTGTFAYIFDSLIFATGSVTHPSRVSATALRVNTWTTSCTGQMLGMLHAEPVAAAEAHCYRNLKHLSLFRRFYHVLSPWVLSHGQKKHV